MEMPAYANMIAFPGSIFSVMPKANAKSFEKVTKMPITYEVGSPIRMPYR